MAAAGGWDAGPIRAPGRGGAIIGDLESLPIRALMEQWESPAVCVAVVKDDAVVLAEGFGTRELGGAAPADGETLFAIGSCSKAFAAATVALLVSDGVIGWDDRVRDHLSWFEMYDAWVSEHLTVRDLLAHRVGVHLDAENALRWFVRDRDDQLRRMRYVPPVAGFRERYVYSNNLVTAAGQVVAAVSGLDWDEFARRRLWEPLGMGRTTSKMERAEREPNRAMPHILRGGEPCPAPWGNPWFPHDVRVPSGGVISTAHDLAQWLRFQNGAGTHEGRSLIRPEVFAEMHAPHSVMRDPRRDVGGVLSRRDLGFTTWTYGLGWYVGDYRGRKVVRHGGHMRGFHAHVALMPEEGIGVAVAVNRDGSALPAALVYTVFDRALGVDGPDWSGLFLDEHRRSAGALGEARQRRRDERVPGTRPSLAPEAYAGTYLNEATGPAEVAVEGEGLTLRIGAHTADLEHWHYDTFRLLWRWPEPMESFAVFALDGRAAPAMLTIEMLAAFGSFRRSDAAESAGGVWL